MRIAIDVVPLMKPKAGIASYIFYLLSQFIKNAPENDYYLCDMLWGQRFYNLIGRKKDLPNMIRFLENMSRIAFPLQITARIAYMWYAKMIREAVRVEEMDLFFGPSFKGIFRKAFKTVITIHDMSHEYYPETVNQIILNALKKELPQTAQNAHAIIAVSQNTKKDILKFLKIPENKVKVIYHGVDEQFRPINDKELLDVIKKKYDLPPRFILYVGAIQPRKNISGIIRAYRILRKDPNFKHHLVMAGGVGWKNKDIYRLVEELGLKNQIKFSSYIETTDLPAIYNLSEVFVFPSFYEGFGFPVLESMACGVPVITSNVSSLPEIGGNAVVYVNPHSVEEIADAVRMVLSDEALRNRCTLEGLERAKLFTWEKCGNETLKTFEEALKR
jgi:glycosyltransferase involved in cell wall biosynthesis